MSEGKELEQERALCPDCNAMVRLCKDGTLGRHVYGSAGGVRRWKVCCTGSQKKPMSLRSAVYCLDGLTELEMRLLFNGLKYQAGDFECQQRSVIWGDAADELKAKFPDELKW